MVERTKRRRREKGLARGAEHRHRSVGAVLAAAGAAAGAVLVLVGSSLPTPSAAVVGGNVPVNAGATDRLDVTSHNSPSLAQNPTDRRTLAVVNRIDTPRFSCALHVSADGGATWDQRFVPFPEGEEAPPRCYAPDVAFGPDGTMYVSFVTLRGAGNVPNAAWVTSSKDGGRVLGPPVKVAGPLAFQVRLSADHRRPGRLYLSWLQASATATLALPTVGHPIVAARSDDGGATWATPVRVTPSSRSRVVAPSTVVGPKGELYLLYLDLGEDVLDYHGGHGGRGGDPYPGTWSLVLARSGDEGTTWREAVVEERIVPSERFVVFLPPYPSLAVDGRYGRVYAAFHDARLGDPDVWLWASDDGGATFGPARRVNDTPRADGTSQTLPKVAVAPGGRLDVVYYDRRADPDDVMNEVSFQSSFDHGRTFSTGLRLSDRPFDARVGPGGERGLPDLGSRLALVSTEHGALAVWTDTRAGTAASKKQDLARSVVWFSSGSPLRAPLRRAGIVLSAGGVVVVLLVLLGRHRRRRAGAGPGAM